MCCRMYCCRMIWTLLNILITSNNFVVLKSHGIWFELDISGISGNGTTGSGSGGDNRTAAAWIGWWRWCGWHVKRIGRGQHVQINTEYPHVRFRFRFCVCVVLLLKFDNIIFEKSGKRFICVGFFLWHYDFHLLHTTKVVKFFREIARIKRIKMWLWKGVFVRSHSN